MVRRNYSEAGPGSLCVSVACRVWWGSWTYYFDPLEAEKTGSINWYKLGPGKAAWTESESRASDLALRAKELRALFSGLRVASGRHCGGGGSVCLQRCTQAEPEELEIKDCLYLQV